MLSTEAAGDLLGHRRLDGEIAFGEVPHLVHQAQNRVLVGSVGAFDLAALSLGLLGAPAGVAEVHHDEERDVADRQQDQHGKHDEVGGAPAEFRFISLGELLRGGEQRLGVVYHFAAGLLGVHQGLEVAENRGDRRLELLVGLLQFGELCQLLRVLRPPDAQHVAALDQALHQLPEAGGVLAHEERHFRVDHVGAEHGVRVFRKALRQHDQLPGERDFARRRLGLQFERLDLLGEVEQHRVVAVDLAHRGAEADQVLALREHELRASVRLVPFLGQRVEIRLHGVGARRQGNVARLPAQGEQLERGDEFVPRLLQLLERLGAPDEAGLRRLGDALAQHAHLRGGRNVDRSVGRLAVVDEHDDRGRDKENRKGRAEDGVLPADADRAQAEHPPLRPFRDGRRSGRTPNRRFDGHRRGPGRGFGQRFWRLRSGRYAPFAFRLGRQSEKCHKSLLELALGSMRARRPHAENRRARRVRRCSARATGVDPRRGRRHQARVARPPLPRAASPARSSTRACDRSRGR